MTEPTSLRPEDRTHAEAGLLPLPAVLTPCVAGASALVLLVLGHPLQLAGVRGTLPGSLIAAGWTLALVAATSTLVGLAVLLGSALRGQGDSKHPPPGRDSKVGRRR